MIWYVALVAILNLGLGYLLAVYLGADRKDKRPKQVIGGSEQYDSYGDDEFESAQLNGFEVTAVS
jgi:hypothetical protein